MRSLRRTLSIFALGGLGGALFDQIHVRFGVLGYPRDDLLLQSWWVAPNFGLAAVSVWLGTRLFLQATRDEVPADPRELLQAAIWFAGAYLASGLLIDQPELLGALYAVTWLGRMAVRPDRGRAAVHGLILAAAGTAYEAFLSSTGAFHYFRPHLATVPLWLPGLYLHAAPLGLAATRALRTRPVPSAA